VPSWKATVTVTVQVVHVLAALRIPDLLADGPKTAEQLAGPAGAACSATNTHLVPGKLRPRMKVEDTHGNNIITENAPPEPYPGVASAAALWRVLRLAVAQGVLVGSADASGAVRFRNTAVSATLRSDHPSTVRLGRCSTVQMR
jgi:hypothetical protein